MPSCTVKQPNGKYAVWSTVVDTFVLLNATREEVIDFFAERGDSRAERMAEFEHIEKSGTAWDWAGDWNQYIKFLQDSSAEGFEEATSKLVEIVELGIPLNMEQKIGELEHCKYWKTYWRNKCERLELRDRLAKEQGRQ